MMLSKQCPDGQPAPPGSTKDLKVCVMTFFANIERQADRIAPALIVLMGLFLAMNTAGLVGV